jgi:hypothetical protein
LHLPKDSLFHKWLIAALLVAGTLLSALTFHTLELHDDNLQILRKVHKLLIEGEWAHFGNRGTHVGFVPGSLMTALTALPMKIYYSPYSAMAVIFIFHLLSLLLLARASRKLAEPAPTLLTCLLLLFWLNPWRVEQSELYNPAYLFLFAALHLWSGLEMKERNFWMTFWHICSIGFCFQFHYSALILAFCTLLLWYTRWYRLHWGGVAMAVAAVALSLVPWALASLNRPELAVSIADSSSSFLGRNFLLVYPVLKAISYWIRYGSSYFGRHIFSEIEFAWIQWSLLAFLVSQTFHALKWIAAAATVALHLRWCLQLWRRVRSWNPLTSRRGREHSDLERFYIYMYVLFLSMVLAAGLSPVEFNHWHLLLCFPAISLFVSYKLHLRLQRWSAARTKRFVLLLATVLIVYNMLAAAGSRSHSIQNNYHKSALEYLQCYPHCG